MKTRKALLAFPIILAVAGATASAATIDPDLNNETYTINGASGSAVVTGDSVLTGTVNVNQGFFVDYLVVGGGGGGGSAQGGGGGAGGLRYGTLEVAATGYAVTVGNGGAKPPSANNQASSGGLSKFATIQASGGGGGGSRNVHSGVNGGSGGGKSRALEAGVGGLGNIGSYTPPEGFDGGGTGAGNGGSGGGGATAAGVPSGSGSTGGNGGAGYLSSITGTALYYAGGGGGGRDGTTAANGLGGSGVGGDAGQPGLDGRGGGGGGGINLSDGAKGGSGIVIVRYENNWVEAGDGDPFATGGTTTGITEGAVKYTAHSFTPVGSSTFTVPNLSNRLAATLTGNLSGGGTLVYGGPGTLTLSGSNSYTGATNVNAGTLLINGDQTGATGNVTVASGATLGGAGIIGGAVTVSDNAILAPGASAGTLTLGGSLALNPLSLLSFELGTTNSFGVGNDLVAVNGAFVLDGKLNVTQLPSFGPQLGGAAGVYELFTYNTGNSFTDNGLLINSLGPNSSGWIGTIVASNGQVTLSVIPEPASLALLVFGALALLRRRK